MMPNHETLPLVVAMTVVTVAAQLILIAKMGRASPTTRHALKSLPGMYLISSAGALLGILGMYGVPHALRALRILLPLGIALVVILRVGIVEQRDESGA